MLSPSSTALDGTASFSVAGPAGEFLPELLIAACGPDASAQAVAPPPNVGRPP